MLLAASLALAIASSDEASPLPDQSCLVMFGTNDSDFPIDDYVWQRTALSLRKRNAVGDRSVIIWARWLKGASEAENMKTAIRQAEDLRSRIAAANIPAKDIRIVAQGSAQDGERGFLAITFGSPVRDSALASSPLLSC